MGLGITTVSQPSQPIDNLVKRARTILGTIEHNQAATSANTNPSSCSS